MEWRRFRGGLFLASAVAIDTVGNSGHAQTVLLSSESTPEPSAEISVTGNTDVFVHVQSNDGGAAPNWTCQLEIELAGQGYPSGVLAYIELPSVEAEPLRYVADYTEGVYHFHLHSCVDEAGFSQDGYSIATLRLEPVPVPLDGQCGTAFGSERESPPDVHERCAAPGDSAYVPLDVDGQFGTYDWLCGGRFGGADAFCSAIKIEPSATPVNGSCGVAAGQTLPVPPQSATEQCTTGSYVALDEAGNDGTFDWSCNGSDGGVSAYCSAGRADPPVDTDASFSGERTGTILSSVDSLTWAWPYAQGSCTAYGAWSGNFATQGHVELRHYFAGNKSYGLTCGNDTSQVSLEVHLP